MLGLFLTLRALCSSLSHCFSSVASESGVPMDAKTLSNGIVAWSRIDQASIQFGGLRGSRCVRTIVSSCIVRSDRLRTVVYTHLTLRTDHYGELLEAAVSVK